MNEWWQSLVGPERVFWGIAIASTILQILMFAGSLIAGSDVDADVDAGSDAGHGDAGVKFLSVRALVAFFVGFGWAGAMALHHGYGLEVATLIAFLSGLVFMGVIFAIMRVMMSLRDDGTLNYQNAIGQTCQVYVTIPAARSGRGQVELMIQGRLITVQAVTEHSAALPPQASVAVTAMEPGNLLVVKPLH